MVFFFVLCFFFFRLILETQQDTSTTRTESSRKNSLSQSWNSSRGTWIKCTNMREHMRYFFLHFPNRHRNFIIISQISKRMRNMFFFLAFQAGCETNQVEILTVWDSGGRYSMAWRGRAPWWGRHQCIHRKSGQERNVPLASHTFPLFHLAQPSE